MDLSTPALLFSTISLLLLAYTNRFIALAALIRNLHAQYKQQPDKTKLKQIKSLKLRVRLIRDMQVLGIISLLMCVVAMFLVYNKHAEWADYLFGASLVLLILSLSLSLAELFISIKALNIQLADLEQDD